MIDILFGFRGTLTKRQYFGWHFGVACLGGFLLALLFHVMALTNKGGPATLSPLALLPFGLFFVPFMWMGLSIQAARMRDIGFRPLHVVLTFALVYLVTTAAWVFAPDGSMAKILSMLYRGLGVAYSALLLFAPSGYVSHWISPEPDDTDQIGRRVPVAYVATTSTVAGGNKTSFGQRGLNRR